MSRPLIFMMLCVNLCLSIVNAFIAASFVDQYATAKFFVATNLSIYAITSFLICFTEKENDILITTNNIA